MTTRYASFNAIFLLMKAEIKMRSQCTNAQEQIEQLLNDVIRSTKKHNCNNTVTLPPQAQ